MSDPADDLTVELDLKVPPTVLSAELALIEAHLPELIKEVLLQDRGDE